MCKIKYYLGINQQNEQKKLPFCHSLVANGITAQILWYIRRLCVILYPNQLI